MTEIPGLFERVAREICKVNDSDPDGLNAAVEVNWKLYVSDALAAIAAHEAGLSDAGMVIVPREPKSAKSRRVLLADAMRATCYSDGSVTVFLTNHRGKAKASIHYSHPVYRAGELRAVISALESAVASSGPNTDKSK